MAPSKAAVATAKKHRLTFNQLAAYDDILTDALVDHVSFIRDNIPYCNKK